MTGYLLDTHVLLWWADNPHQLSDDARLAIASGRNTLFVSHASLWELQIKISMGKLSLPSSPEELVKRSRCHLLPIAVSHINAIASLPHHHADPFDRMLLAQAKVETLTIITRDKAMKDYAVNVLAA